MTCFQNADLSLAGRLSDISESGMGLILRMPVAVGSSVAVEWGEVIAFADVVHCGPAQDSSYRLGLKTSYIVLDRTASK